MLRLRRFYSENGHPAPFDPRGFSWDLLQHSVNPNGPRHQDDGGGCRLRRPSGEADRDSHLDERPSDLLFPEVFAEDTKLPHDPTLERLPCTCTLDHPADCQSLNNDRKSDHTVGD